MNNRHDERGVRALRRLLWLLGALGTMSCSMFPRRFALTTGESLSELVSGDSSVVAIFDPAACMACDNTLPDWFRWAETHPRRFALVLTRPPTPAEVKRMILRRVSPAGVLRREFAVRPLDDGGVHYALFVGRRLQWLEAASASTLPQSGQAVVERWLRDADRQTMADRK